jgi:protein-S-isoprenylcysteine O-methyltransferase Ste14
MKKYLNIYLIVIGINLMLSIVFSFGKFGYDTGFSFGTLNLIVGVLMLVIGLIMLIAGSKENGKMVLAASGLILLTGGVFCTIFPFRLNG